VFQPRSRRPKTSPNAISDEVAGLIVRLRKELSGRGLDAGPDTICWHLRHHHQVSVSAATVSRYLTRHGLVVPEPRKRPRSSFRRFAYARPRDCYQIDATELKLAGGQPAVAFDVLDDCTRLLAACHAAAAETAAAAAAAARACSPAPSPAWARGSSTPAPTIPP
jgi:hypothetical protein